MRGFFVVPLLGFASAKDPSIWSIALTKHNRLSIFDTRQHPDKNKFE
jgi:hypothetical protein